MAITAKIVKTVLKEQSGSKISFDMLAANLEKQVAYVTEPTEPTTEPDEPTTEPTEPIAPDEPTEPEDSGDDNTSGGTEGSGD